MVINLEHRKIHFDLRFILTYNMYNHSTSSESSSPVLSHNLSFIIQKKQCNTSQFVHYKIH